MLNPDLLILDADDTLWESARFFRRTEDDFLALVESLGTDPAQIRSVIHTRDLERLTVTGYGARPYIDTLSTILNDIPGGDSIRSLQSFRDIEHALVTHPVLLMPGVLDTLSEISVLGIPSVIYTVGEFEHQNSKFIRSGLQEYVNALHVVDHKTPDALGDLISQYSARPDLTVLVGNSPKSDINPALINGVNAVYIPAVQSWSAEMEEILHPPKVTVIDSFSEVLSVLQQFRCSAEGFDLSTTDSKSTGG